MSYFFSVQNLRPICIPRSMNEREFQFSSSIDGVELNGTIALPTGSIKGQVLSFD